MNCKRSCGLVYIRRIVAVTVAMLVGGLSVVLLSGGCVSAPAPVASRPHWMAMAYQGDPYGQAMLSLDYVRADEGFPTDYTLGYVWAQQSAARNHPLGQFCLGRFFYFGLGTPRDHEKGVALFLQAQPGLNELAGEGDPEAQCALAFLYSLPYPDPHFQRDDHKAMTLLSHAAAQDYLPAMTSLGTLLLFGADDVRDLSKATSLLRMAAARGYAPAQCILGLTMTVGAASDRDKKEGILWLRRAADQGLRDGQYYLALHLQNGWGTNKDPVEAAKWFEAAAKQTSPGGGGDEGNRSLSDVESRGGLR